jgi:uncharacterized SAM-binding protein YcdF (DUF218 family)
MAQLGPPTPAASVYSVPQAEDPPYTATSLLLAGRYAEAAQMTRRIIDVAYRPQARAPWDQPTNYARTLLILALAAAGLGDLDQAVTAGTAALDCGRVVWPTMVLAGKLDSPMPRPQRTSTPVTSTQARASRCQLRALAQAGSAGDRRRAGPERVAALTAAVDIEASPPDGEPVALVLFGTNQAAPAQIATARYHAGAAPLVIATGGVNRHNGIIEGREFARQLTRAGVPGDAIRVEDQSKDTWQNVELSLSYLREAVALGLRLAVVSKWYHLRTIYCLATQLPEAAPFYAISWEPVYAGTLVTRASWPKIPDGRRRVLRESQEVPRRVAEGTYRAARKADGAWQLS